jgi:5-methylcytosine-specific restriction endonuclease McrA
MADEIIARKDALAQGLKYYFTGKPCKNGHVSKRWSVHRLCVGCINDFHARWYVANRDKKLKKNKQYLKDNPDVGRAAALKWRNQNLERARQYASKWYSDSENNEIHHGKRRARKLGGGGTHTRADLAAILKAQNYRCAYCDADLRKVKRHVDHIKPLSSGGSNDKTNIQYLCQPCNLSKGAKDPLQFAQELGRLL